MRNYSRRLLVSSVAPASEPVTLAEAKLYLRLDGSEEDALVTSLISAARASAEHYLRKSLMTQSWSLTLESFAGNKAVLTMGPVLSITSVTTIDEAGNETTLATTAYRLAGGSVVVITEGQLADRLVVVYAAGYGDAEDVPAPIKQGMLMHVTRLYERCGEDDTATGIPAEAIALYAPYRELSV